MYGRTSSAGTLFTTIVVFEIGCVASSDLQFVYYGDITLIETIMVLSKYLIVVFKVFEPSRTEPSEALKYVRESRDTEARNAELSLRELRGNSSKDICIEDRLFHIYMLTMKVEWKRKLKTKVHVDESECNSICQTKIRGQRARWTVRAWMMDLGAVGRPFFGCALMDLAPLERVWARGAPSRAVGRVVRGMHMVHWGHVEDAGFGHIGHRWGASDIGEALRSRIQGSARVNPRVSEAVPVPVPVTGWYPHVWVRVFVQLAVRVRLGRVIVVATSIVSY
ncbi:hypothetical protein BU15DRAFT_64386 [Melanogaster broomeanus]|nr:hypothetical protein BU15DRAFT_64386 [Melanogaster broomeanus]